MSRKKVCILVFSQIAYDSRVLREVDLARQHYDVDVIAYGNWQPPEGVTYHQLAFTPYPDSLRFRWLLPGRMLPALYDRYFWWKPEHNQALSLLLDGGYDLVHANDWDSQPVAVKAAREKGFAVLYDCHEYSPEQGANNLVWRMLVKPYREYLLRAYNDHIGHITTVSEGLVQLYHKLLGWNPTIIMNAQRYQPVPFRPVDPQHIRIIHHGVANTSRNLEDFLKLVALLDNRFSLTLLFAPGKEQVVADLKVKANSIAPGRVTFLVPVTPAEIIRTVSQYDIGIPFIRASHLNYVNVLPNKFFDYLIGGLCLAITPLKMMQCIVEASGAGIVAEDTSVDTLAKAINSLTPAQIDACKQHALELAKTMNAEAEMAKLLAIYQSLLAGSMKPEEAA